MSEEGFVPKHGGIQIVDPKDKGLPADLIYSAMSNKTLASELRQLAMRFPFGSAEFGILGEAHDRLASWS